MTKFWLCENIPFNNSYDNVVGFDNETQQQSYFIGLSVGGPQPSNNFRIIDNKVTIRVDRSYEECKELNYMVLLQGGKYYYLFIDSIGYIDNVTTQVNATIDVWQTYMFDYEIKDAFISREHQDRFKKVGNKLEPIYNLESENIELGEVYDTVDLLHFKDPKEDYIGTGTYTGSLMWSYIITTKPLTSSDSSYVGQMRSVARGVPSGTYLYVIPFNNSVVSRVFYSISDSENIELYNRNDISKLMVDPNIQGIYLSRYAPLNYEHWHDSSSPETVGEYIRIGNIGSNDHKFIRTNGMIPIVNFQETKINISELIDIYNYTPNIDRDIMLEPKLKTSPYTVYSFTNGVINPVDFSGNELEEYISYIETHSLDYKAFIGFIKNDYGLYYGEHSTKNNELPMLTDKYLDYKARNKATSTTGVAISAGQVVAGATMLATGMGSFVGAGLMIGGTQKIINEMLKQSDLKQSPRSVRELGNNIVHSINVDMSDKPLLLSCMIRKVKPQFYNRAYEYFYRNGYKANNYGIPNLKSRSIFNFIKTIDITIGGNINQNIKVLLENMFNNGVRIWHYKDNFNMYDYTKENWEVSLI